MSHIFKKFLAVCLVVLMITSVLPMSIGAADTDDNCFEYRLLDDGTAYITKYTGTASEVVIPSEIDGYTVSEAGPTLFTYDCGVEKVTFPESVTKLNDYIFYGNKTIKEVKILGNVETLPFSTFQFCDNLEEVTLPASLTLIKDSAFGNNSNVAIHFAGDAAQWKLIEREGNNWALDNAVVDYGKEYRNLSGDYAYVVDTNGDCIITRYYGHEMSVEIPMMLDDFVPVKIGDGAFRNCGAMLAAMFRGNIKEIGNGAFENCLGLQMALCPGVEKIGDRAWANCTRITSATIPASVTSIGEDVLDGTAVKTVYYNGTPDQFAQISIAAKNDALFSANLSFPTEYFSAYDFDYELTNGKILLKKYNGAAEELVIPAEIDGNPVTRVDTDLFKGNTTLKKVTFPETVTGVYAMFPGNTTIEEVVFSEGLTSINYRFAENAANLKKITLPSTLTNIEDKAFEGTGLEEVVFNGPQRLWLHIDIAYNNMPLKNASFTFTGSIVTDSTGLYKYEAIDETTCAITDYLGEETEVVIPEALDGYTVTTIGSRAFYSKESITKLTVPASVTTLEPYAFYCCYVCREFVLNCNITEIPAHAFDGCGGVKIINIPNTVKVIGDYALSLRTIQEIDIPDGVVELGKGVFESAEELTKISLPLSLRKIGQLTFCGTHDLKEVVFHGEAEDFALYDIASSNQYLFTAVPSGASKEYKNGDNIANLYPTGVLGMTGYDWPMVTTIKIPETINNYTVVKIEDDAYMNIATLENVEIASSVLYIGRNAFKGCTSLNSLTLSEGIRQIDSRAFENTALTELVIPLSLQDVEYMAFSGAPVTDVYFRGTPQNYTHRTPFFSAEPVRSAVMHYKPFDNTYGDFEFEFNSYPADTVTITKYLGNDTTVVIPYDIFGYRVTAVSDGLLKGNTTITSVNIPSISTIPESFCEGCENLELVLMSGSTYTVKANAFKDCDNLFLIFYGGSYEKFWRSITFEEGNECLTRTTNSFTGTYDNKECYCYEYMVMLPGNAKIMKYTGYDEDYVIPETVNGYPVVACHPNFLKDNTYVKSVTVPAGMYSFGLNNCSSLEKVVFEEGIEYIYSCCLYLDTALKEVWIPESVTEISTYVFDGCRSLETIYYAGSSEEWNEIIIGEYGNDILQNVNIVCAKDGPVCDHANVSDWIVVCAASCTEDGRVEKHCLDCGALISEEVIPAAHDFDSMYTFDVQPTPTTVGQRSRHCTRCDAVTDVSEVVFTLGDCDGDGEASSKDSRLIKKYLVSMADDDNIAFLCVDFDGDGEITTRDSKALKKLLIS